MSVKMNELDPAQMTIIENMNLSHAQVASIFNISDPDIIYQKRRRMGLLKIKPLVRKNKGKRFTKRDIAILEDTTKSHEEVANILGRTIASIQTSRSKRDIELNFSNMGSSTPIKQSKMSNTSTELTPGQKAAETKRRNKATGKTNASPLTDEQVTRLMSGEKGEIQKLVRETGRSLSSLYASRHHHKKNKIATVVEQAPIAKKPVKIESKDLVFIINGTPVTIDGKIKNARIGLNKIELNF